MAENRPFFRADRNVPLHQIKLELRRQDLEGIHLPSFRFSWKLKKLCRVDFLVFESWQTVVKSQGKTITSLIDIDLYSYLSLFPGVVSAHMDHPYFSSEMFEDDFTSIPVKPIQPLASDQVKPFGKLHLLLQCSSFGMDLFPHVLAVTRHNFMTLLLFVGLSFISRSNKALTGASSINTVCQKILN
jgi:hypothetical protein